MAMMLAALDASIVNTALPRMAADLGGLAHLSWVVTSFMLFTTITSPLYGKLSDLYGRRTMFIVSILIFLAGSALCGAAGTMDELIGFRALQGLGAGGLLVLAQSAIADVVPPRERPRYQGLFTGTFALASIAGPLLGGIITQALSWRWIFYVNLPIGAVALVMIAAGLRNPVRAARRPVDFAGALLLTGLTAALLLLLAWGGTQFPWLSAQSLGLASLLAAFLALFVWREARAPEPLIRLALFRNPIFARGSLAGGMIMFAMLGSLVFLPLYFQLVLGQSPAVSGLMVLPQVACMVLSSIIGGRAVSRIGRYRKFLLAGILSEFTALAGLAILAVLGAPAWPFLAALAVLGTGIGMAMPNLTNAVQNAVARTELGAATGAMIFIRSLGGAVGVAASGTIMTARLKASLAHASGGLDLATLTAHGAGALAGLGPARQAEIAGAYRTALTGSFLLSAVVMAGAFALVFGLKETALRRTIEDPA